MLTFQCIYRSSTEKETEQSESILIYISELDHAEFSQLAHATVGRLRLEEELGQGHLLASEELPHDDNRTPTSG